MTVFQIRLSSQQTKALKACARARGQSCHAVLDAAVATVLGPYVAKQQDDSRRIAAREKSEIRTGPLLTDLELDFAEDQLLRKLAGLPAAE
jgi:predicted transcriptional regulator